MTMADRVAVYKEGGIQQIAAPEELYHKPANLFVAGFIGALAMNFFDATLTRKNGDVILDAEWFKIILPGSLIESVGIQEMPSEVVIGIRPEHVRIHKEKVPGSIETKIYVVEPLGSETIIDFKIGETIYKIKYYGDLKFDTGDRIYVTFDIDKIHIFDKETGKAIV